MSRLYFALASTVSAVALMSTAAVAADLYVPEAPAIPVVEVAGTYAVELGVAAGWLFQSSDPEDVLGDDEDDSFGLVEFTARFGVPVASNLYLQFDLDAERGFPGFEGENNAYVGSVVGGAHMAYRDAGFLAGGFVGGGAIYDNDDEVGNGTVWTAGLEAQAYLDALTITGQVGYLDSNGLSDSQEGLGGAWYGRGIVAYFLDENTKLQGEVSAGRGIQDAGEGDDADATTFVGWGAEIEHQFGDGMSAFLGYDGIKWDEDSDSDEIESLTSHVVKVGLRWSIDGKSLHKQSQGGADLSLPNVGYWAAGVTPVD